MVGPPLFYAQIYPSFYRSLNAINPSGPQNECLNSVKCQIRISANSWEVSERGLELGMIMGGPMWQ